METKQLNKVQIVIIHTPRLLLLLILVVILIPLLFGGLRNCQGNIMDNMPPVDKAPWAVQTYTYTGGERVPSRYYLGESFATINGIPTLNGYWTLEGNSFEYHANMIEFSPSEYGPVTIIRRK